MKTVPCFGFSKEGRVFIVAVDESIKTPTRGPYHNERQHNHLTARLLEVIDVESEGMEIERSHVVLVDLISHAEDAVCIELYGRLGVY